MSCASVFLHFNKISKKSDNVMYIMAALFLMPLVPFGAICYFGASSRIKYWKYILICIIFTLPSILSSNLQWISYTQHKVRYIFVVLILFINIFLLIGLFRPLAWKVIMHSIGLTVFVTIFYLLNLYFVPFLIFFFCIL